MSAININKNNFQNEVVNSDKPVLLDFWASWCAPCRMVVPIVEEIASERRDIKVGKINVDEEPELANKFSIMSIPTLVVMKNGNYKRYSSWSSWCWNFLECRGLDNRMRIEEILAMEIDDRQFCRTEIQADDVERVLRAALLATCGKEGNSVELYPVEEIVKPLSWKHRQPWRCPQW